MRLQIKNPITLREILNDTTAPPEPIIDDGLLLDGTILLIVGPPKSKKTFFTQNLALSLAAGSEFAGFSVPKPRKVLYNIAEGGYYPNRERLKTMTKNLNEHSYDNFMMGNFGYMPLNEQDRYEAMYGIIQETEAEVVIFDPLIRFHDVDENSASQMSEVFGRIRTYIEELGISVILIHHSGRVQKRGGRGSSAIIGEYDSCVTLHKVNKHVTSLSYDMRHVESPPSNQIVFNSDTLWFESSSPLVDILKKSGGSMPKKDFIEEYGKSQATTYRHIEKAVKSGSVTEEEDQLILTDVE
jgi:RecA-family ATPase